MNSWLPCPTNFAVCYLSTSGSIISKPHLFCMLVLLFWWVGGCLMHACPWQGGPPAWYLSVIKGPHHQWVAQHFLCMCWLARWQGVGIAPGRSTVSVPTVECIGYIDQQDCLCVFLFKNLIHGLHGCLTGSFSQLGGPCDFLDVYSNDAALPIMRQMVSPTPIIRTAGF